MASKSNATQRRRARLAALVGVMFSGLFFGPVSWLLFSGGRWILLIFVLFFWLMLGRFFYGFLAPYSPRHRPENEAATARDRNH